MKVSKKGMYALRVMRRLADAYGQGPLSATELAATEGISLKYLEQVLNILKRAGFLVATRGKEGGYALRIPPGEVSLGDIVRATDGPLAPIPCASRRQPHRDCDCDYPFEHCWMRQLMLRVRDSIASVMDGQTLEQMAADARVADRIVAESGTTPRPNCVENRDQEGAGI